MKAWNAEEVKTLRDMAQFGHPAASISRVLGRTQAAVDNKARQLRVVIVSGTRMLNVAAPNRDSNGH